LFFLIFGSIGPFMPEVKPARKGRGVFHLEAQPS
jgi:hypothetical protein